MRMWAVVVPASLKDSGLRPQNIYTYHTDITKAICKAICILHGPATYKNPQGMECIHPSKIILLLFKHNLSLVPFVQFIYIFDDSVLCESFGQKIVAQQRDRGDPRIKGVRLFWKCEWVLCRRHLDDWLDSSTHQTELIQSTTLISL